MGEIVLAAFVAAAASVVVAAISRSDKRAESSRQAIIAIEKKLETNGSKKEVGELVEIIYQDLQTVKRDHAVHAADWTAHGLAYRRGLGKETDDRGPDS